MKLELLFIIITGIIIYNIYNENKYLKLLLKYKKYYHIIFIIFGSFILYLMIKKNPNQSKNMLITANNMIKYLPIDKNTSNLLNPLFTLTSNQDYNNFNNTNNLSFQMKNLLLKNNSKLNNFQNYQNTAYQTNSNTFNINNNDKNNRNNRKATKRSVSETKKKYIAYLQDWKCGKCQKRLNHTFEVDHKIRLEYGGGNDVSNLIALCRECHGQKTALENM